ncbi:MAG TPA: L-seryl-tRNA(Sec) selenium transferase [Casimicrobiaceae bacterium]
MTSRLASLPSVDRLLNTATLRRARERHGHERVVTAVRAHLADLRAGAPREIPGIDAIAQAVDAALDARARPSLRKVINLTGTVLHTNLGRALLPQIAIDALVQAAGNACNLEFDLDEGTRGERDAHVEDIVRALTGAEAALVVNNNAAAVLLVLNTLAQRREVIVSRGELVEIGGQFRIPDIMARAGCRLREVGTTNRTHPLDYTHAIDARTALLLKVHTSNYEVRGFTSSVDIGEVAAIAHARDLPAAVDLGSGTLLDMRQWGLPYEPTVRGSLEAGADLVTFSGDKLLGGPQCGIVAGRARLVDRMRRNPLKRALRVDKLVLAALEQVLRLHLNAERLPHVLPTLRLLVRKPEDIAPGARRLADALAKRLPPRYVVAVVECRSQIGSGALPVDVLPSVGVRITSRSPRRQRDRDVQQMKQILRALDIPVLGRIDDHALLLDCRCLEDVDEALAALDGISRAIT